MDSREFIERFKDSLICEPSGRSYSQLKEDAIMKMRIVNENDNNNDNNEDIIEELDRFFSKYDNEVTDDEIETSFYPEHELSNFKTNKKSRSYSNFEEII